MKFVRKPSVIEAIQWKGGSQQHPGVIFESGKPCLMTIHGQLAYLSEGDWIMPEPDGVHFYPCKDEVFRASYEPVNTYDKGDTVRRGNMLKAGPVKIAEYTVRDPETGEHGVRQFHMTVDNTVMAVMGEESAKLFSRFVTDALNPERRKAHMDLVPSCRKFIDDNGIRCAETIYQVDRVAENALPLIETICECIGYATGETES